MHISSQLLEQAVQAFSRLPGIGKKTALRLALHLLQSPEEETESFCKALQEMRSKIQFCSICHNLSDAEICQVCASPKREQSLICLVEGIREAMAIENTGQYNGSYHILGGLISPIEGIGPEQLTIDSLKKRVESGEVKEIIMALSPTIEGDTTIYYISRLLKNHAIQISNIARGVSFGGELEYADEITLGRSIIGRLPYKGEE